MKYGQAQLRKISRMGATPANASDSASTAPNGGAFEVDCISWMVPTGHLHGPSKDGKRYLRMLMQRTVEKAASQIKYEATNLSCKRRKVTTSLLKSLRYKVNRGRNFARLLGYRTLGFYMDSEVERASMERIVSTPASTAGEGVDDGFSDPIAQDSNIGYQLILKEGDTRTDLRLDLSRTAAGIIAELLLMEPSEVWTSVRTAGALCLKGYIEAEDYPKYLRPESAEARKGIVQSMHDELKDLEVRDVDLSDEEAD